MLNQLLRNQRSILVLLFTVTAPALADVAAKDYTRSWWSAESVYPRTPFQLTGARASSEKRVSPGLTASCDWNSVFVVCDIHTAVPL